MRNFSTLQKRALMGCLALAVLLLLAWRVVYKPADAASQSAPPAIAVDTAAAGHTDVPIFLQGLGTVQAFYTVTVTARVDGEIQKIGFTEGETVH
jgi:multidrug efflux system membrane fusion protein